MILFHDPAPFWDAWRAWFLSDGIGIVMTAPLVIQLGQVWRKLPSRVEAIEGVGVLSLVGLIGFDAIAHPTGSWLSIVYALTFGIGHLGDAGVPLAERVNGAQLIITTVTLCTLVLTGLFTQRRDSEAQLSKKSGALARLNEISSRLWLKRDLRQAFDEILAGAIELMAADAGIIRVLELTRGALKIEAHRGIKQELLYPFHEMPAAGKSACARALRLGERVIVADVESTRPVPPSQSLTRAAGFRSMQSTPIKGREGTPLGVLSTHFYSVHRPSEQDLRLLDLYVRQAADIIERHKAEDALRESEERLRERNAQLALASRAALVGSYVYDVNKGTTQISQGYATIHGLPEGTTDTTIGEWRARVHPEDLARAEGLREQAFADRRKEDNAEYRIILPTGEVRWIERRGSVSYDEDGGPERVVGVNIDVTERKRAEQHQRALNAELDHRVKNVLATVSAIIDQTQEASGSQTEFVRALNSRINSLARTHELLSASNWRGAPLAEIVRREFAPYTRGNTEAGGPSVTLKAEATQAMATVLHELTTNAAKYGALSTRTGRVSVRWRWLQNGFYDRLLIEWQETGGPPALALRRSGYGTSIIRELIPFELGGVVELSFAPEGTRCRLEIPGEWASRGRQKVEERGALDPA
jgi:PAS domain S-box-containing protein